ncbi:MAG: D-aspartate ligase [Mycobacterium sp.]|jgi:predicted ATP-grasp superfamily ATP-dependent carboligase|nr:D-aspartate ligase [Mycobacterium sp.]
MVLWVTQFPLLHGCVGVFRSLGRAGVPVHAVVADRRAPAALSRYVAGHVLWRPHHGDGPNELIDRLTSFGRRMGRRSLIICTADDMAVLVAQHRSALEEYFVLPTISADLPAQLADKRILYGLCRRHGVGAPRSEFVDSMSQLEAIIDELELPVVVKSTALRGQAVPQSVAFSTVVRSRTALRDLARRWAEPFRTLIQEYIPDEVSEDWIAHGYCDADSKARIVFTGKKVRSWPPRGGATAAGYVAANAELAARTASFCAQIGYRGVFDLDWRRDLRNGQYNLLDFNPRIGAQFRMFEDDAGIDVVRAMHLDMSGRAIPPGSPVEGERFIVEPWDLASRLADRHGPKRPMGGSGRPRLAWLAGDDPLPVLAMILRQGALSTAARIPRTAKRATPPP